jgi:hypothetical protein
VPRDSDARFSARISAALDGITAQEIYAVADLIASSTAGPEPAAVRGVDAVTEQLAEQQVAVLLVAAGTALDEQVWTALRQDAIVAQLPASSGPLAGQQAAALLRRGAAS